MFCGSSMLAVDDLGQSSASIARVFHVFHVFHVFEVEQQKRAGVSQQRVKVKDPYLYE